MPLEQVITTVKTIVNISEEKIVAAYSKAERKLRHIIKTEGDANGARRTDKYFLQLVYEAIYENAASETFVALYKAEKEQVA